MNRIRTQFLALLALMLAGTGAANATDYGIYVGETMVTSSNAADVLGDGHFKYNASQKTLTVTDATLDNSGTLGTGIDNRTVEGLTIKFEGTNRFTTRMAPICTSCATTITGTGTLYAVCQERAGFECSSILLNGSGKTITINGPKLYFTNKSGSAIYDWKGDCTLKIEGTSTVVSFKTSNSEFAWTHHPLGNLTIGSGLYVTRPYKAYFSSSLHNMTTDGRTAVKGNFLISSKATEQETSYGLYIGETMVTSYNCDDVFGDEMFVYHPSSKELDVRSGTFSNDGTLGGAIDNRSVDGLMIWVTGNVVFRTRNNIISSNKSFSIQGPGTINGTSTEGAGLYLWGDGITCTVAGPTVTLNAATHGLRDYYGTATLEVKAGDRYSLGSSSYATSLTLQPGNDFPAVYNLKKLVRGSNVEISEPRFGFFNSTAMSITEDQYKSTPYKGKVTIGVAWPLYVGGKMVTAKNASKITSEAITAGTVSYDASSKKLTLNGATITSNGDYNCIQNNGVSDLNINVVGTNNLDITSYGGLQLLCLQQNTSITGSGTLNLKTSGRHYCARVFHGSTLTINGPTVNGVSGTNAFAFYPGSSEKLVIKGTSTKVSLTPGNGDAAVDKLSSFELGSGLYVTQPSNASYSSSAKTFTANGEAVTGTLIFSSTNPSSIVSYGMYIGETAVTSFNASDILGNGQFSYNNSTKTLTVTNASLTNTDGTLGGGIDNRTVDGLIVNLIGNSTITARNGAFYTEKKASIYGSGSLTCVSTQSSGCRIASKDGVTVGIINGPNVKFTGKTYGLEDYYGTSTFRVQGSETNVTLTPGSSNPAIYNLKELTLSSTAITQPADGYFSSSLKSITTNGSSSYKGTVNIGGYTDYGVIVGETVVTSNNASDVLGDGCFSYNKSTNTLTVKDANLTNLKGMQGSGILNWSNNGLTVKLEGTSTFYTRNGVIAAQASCSITGSGTINGKSQYGPALSIAGDGITCTVNGPTLDLVSEFGTSVGDYFKNSTLEVKGSSSLTLTPYTGFAAIKDLSKLTLGSGQYITSPAFAEFSTSLKSITVGGVEPYIGKVVISSKSPSTPMYIGETAVKKTNANDILGNGQFSYDIATKTLTVRNANLTNTGSLGGGIDNREIEGLIINLVGNNVLSTRNDPVSSTVSFKITGSGSLTASSTSSAGLWLGSRCDSCIIDGPTLNLTGPYGLRDYQSNSVLRIQGSRTSVTLQPSGSSATINGLKKLDLADGIKIAAPADGYFSENLKSITTNGTTSYSGTVVIGRVEDYGIIIGERIVTSANCKDVLGDGTFSYDPATKTLTVKNANLDNTVVGPSEAGANQGTGISNWSNDGLIINLVGDNVINSRNDVIASQYDVTITGTGTLTGNSVYSNAITLWSQNASTCTIDGPEINITASGAGIYATGTQSLVVKGENTKLNLQPGEDSPAIENLRTLTLEDELRIVEPRNGYFSSSLAGITTDGENLYKGKVAIRQYKDYGIIIGERIVTSDNCTDVLGDGTISYNPSTNTLTLNNANLDNTVVGPSEVGANQGTGISNWSNDGLIVKLEGTNVINSRNAVIASQANMTITGTGTLTGVATESSAMTLWGQNDNTCTINGPKIKLTGATNALWAENHQTLKVEDNSRLTLVPGEGYETVHDLWYLTLGNGIEILKPAGAYFNERMNSIYLGDDPCTTTVVIGKPGDYTMYIAETKVTPNNADDVLGDGSFRYDEDTQTLYVKNAKMENDGSLGSGISNRDIDGLTIVLEGDNEINVRNSIIYSAKNVVINGSGTLKGHSNGSSAIKLATDCQTLVIDGPTIDVTAAGYGLEDYAKNSTVRIQGENTKVTLESPNSSYYTGIGNLYNLELGGEMSIIEPVGGYFSPELGAITTDGTTAAKGKVVIGKGGAGPVDPEFYAMNIGGIAVTSENASDILGDGTISYDAESQTLILRDANLTSENGPGISNYGIPYLTIDLEGHNTINTMFDVIESYESLNIIGTGTLDGYSISLWGDPTGPMEGEEGGVVAPGGIGAYGSGLRLIGDQKTCAIYGPTITLTCENGYGIDNPDGMANLWIGGSETKLVLNPGSGYAAINNLMYLGLDTCLQITEPAGAWFDDYLKTITTDGESVYCGTVVISKAQPWVPEEAMLAFVVDTMAYTNLQMVQNVADEFISPTFVSHPENRRIIWRTNISEHPADGGRPIMVQVNTDPFEVILLNREGSGQTDVSIVAYDEYVTAMATLDISFYADVYQEPDTTTIALVADTANEVVEVSFGGEGSEINENADLTNSELEGVLFTLNDEEGDGYDSTDESIVLNSTMSVEEMEAVFEQMKPGSGVFAAMFSGMTFLLPAGSGSFDIEFLTMGDRALSVKIGDNAAATFMQNEKGTVTLYYECTEDTYVYIYGSEAEAWPTYAPTTTFTKRAPRRAEANDNAVKVYGFNVRPAVISKDDFIKGDVNSDKSVDVADIASVISVMAGQAGYENADVNKDGTVDVADIATIISIMAENARLQKLLMDDTEE